MTCVLTVGPCTAVTGPAAAGPVASTFTPVPPVRVLDTRTTGPVGPGGVARLDLTSRVPAGTTTVVLNVTGTEPTAATYVTAYPSGAPRPGTSNLNLVGGETRANLVTVAVAADRAVNLYNNTGSTHLIADLARYYGPGAGARFIERQADRVASVQLGPGGTTTVDVSSWVPASATAVVVNVTGATPTAVTFLTAWAVGHDATGHVHSERPADRRPGGCRRERATSACATMPTSRSPSSTERRRTRGRVPRSVLRPRASQRTADNDARTCAPSVGHHLCPNRNATV